MEPDTTKIWTRSEVGVSVGKILVESLGVDEGTVTDAAALVRDLGAESIDFLDISFKCQQTFGVDLPARLIQDRLIEWRDLGVLAKVIEGRYGVSAAPEELRTIAPATVAAVTEAGFPRHFVPKRWGGDEGTYAGLKDPKLKPLMLTPAEKSDLVAFLKTLTGNLPDEEWTRDIAKH